MRKNRLGTNPVKKPLGLKAAPASNEPSRHAAAGAATGEFKGFKIASAPRKPAVSSQPKVKAFETTADKAKAGAVGTTMLIVGPQDGDRIVGLGEEESRGPLVIPARRNANWMEKNNRTNKKHNAKDTGTEETESSVSVLSNVSTSESYGLQKVAKRGNKESARSPPTNSSRPQELSEASPPKSQPLSIREEAINELTNAGSSGSSNLVIPLSNQGSGSTGGSLADRERRAYEEDIDECSDEAGDDAYERVPIEEFGAAMLRGMGWREGETIGKYKSKIDPDSVSNAPRPSLLGLGAKPRPEDTLPPKRRINKY